MIRETEDRPLVVATGTVSEAADRLRGKLLKHAGIGVVLLVVGTGVAVGTLVA